MWDKRFEVNGLWFGVFGSWFGVQSLEVLATGVHGLNACADWKQQVVYRAGFVVERQRVRADLVPGKPRPAFDQLD